MQVGKRERATSAGQEVATAFTSSQHCNYCGNTGNWSRCSSCKTVYYCSIECQQMDWSSHKDVCKGINYLTSKDAHITDTNNGLFTCHLTPRQKGQLTQLIGRKCTITCYLNDYKAEALWDTGAQVSVLSKQFIEQHLPSSTIHSIAELVGSTNLDLKAVNGTKLPFEGWVEVTFELRNVNNDTTQMVIVPIHRVLQPLLV